MDNFPAWKPTLSGGVVGRDFWAEGYCRSKWGNLRCERLALHPRLTIISVVDLTPIQMTPNSKLALVMGKFTAEDSVKSLQNSRCCPELVSVQVVGPKVAIAG